MAYFLKKNRKKDKLYLSIVNSYYDSERKQTVHSTYESFGTGQALIDQGISDPIAYWYYVKKKYQLNRNFSI